MQPRQDPVLEADLAAMTIARSLEEIDPLLASAAAAYKDGNTWWRHGFARLEDHCREVFHRSGRWLRDLAALGRAFKKDERLRAAFTGSDGGAPLGRCRAVLIARVATGRTLCAWILLARRCRVDELREHVRAARANGGMPPVDWVPAPTVDDGAEGERDAATNDRRLVDDEEPDTTARCRLTLHVPFPVAVAFDEGLDLYRAIEGSEATVTSYVEALLAEQAASGGYPIAGGTWLSGVERSTQSSRARERSGDLGAPEAEGNGCPPSGSGSGAAPVAGPGEEPSALRRAEQALARLEAVRRKESTGETPDPVDHIKVLVRLEEDLERRLGEVLLSMGEMRAWRRLGFTGAGEYAEQRLGVSRSWAEDRVRAARSLRRFPRLRAAHEDGAIGIEALLRVSSILKSAPDPDAVIDEWVERASECTVKRLRDESRELMRRRAGVFTAMLAGNRVAVERRTPLDDLSWFRSLARRAGTATGRIRHLSEMARGNPVADTPLVLRLPNDIADEFVIALSATESGGATPCRTFSTAADERPGRETLHCGPILAWVGLLALIEGFVRTWDHDRNDPKRPAEVRDTFIAWGWRCSAPGCTSRKHLQVHHVVYRSHGGGDELENLVVACLFHHLRGEHGDLAACRGRSPLAVTWRLGRLGSNGQGSHYRNERRAARIPAGM